jgi:hypothetical protein
MPMHRTRGLYLFDLCGQTMPAVVALLRQHDPDLIDSFGGRQGRCAPRWPGCPPALRWLFWRRPRWRGAPASPSEEDGLEELVGDWLFGVGDLLIPLGYLTPQFLKLSLQPLIFTLQLLTAGLAGVSMSIRRCPLSRSAASRSCTHPPSDKGFGWICPAKSTRVRELLRAAVAGCTGYNQRCGY